MKTGLEDACIVKGGKKLRLGYTTGTCAAAATQAAARCLLLGEQPVSVRLTVPKGIELQLPVRLFEMGQDFVTFGVQKDGGDDPDATHGLWILATVSRIAAEEVVIDGGKGVGTVTKPGLDQPVGAAAINHVPRRMIREQAESVLTLAKAEGGLHVVISVPGGEETALKTFNPRLGILGGISILGTSGIVMPMSEEALIATTRVEIQAKKAAGARFLLLVPGNYGEDFLKKYPYVDPESAVKCSNFIGASLEIAEELAFEGVLLVSHIGKAVKISGGIMNTHSHQADCRAELLAAQAFRSGASPDTVRKLLDTGTTEEAVSLLKETGDLQRTMEETVKRIVFYMQHHINGKLRTEVITFSSQWGILGASDGAEEMLKYFRK